MKQWYDCYGNISSPNSEQQERNTYKVWKSADGTKTFIMFWNTEERTAVWCVKTENGVTTVTWNMIVPSNAENEVFPYDLNTNIEVSE